MRTRRGAWWIAGGWFASLALATLDAAATPQLRLVYIREAGTESCPQEMELRMSVASRLGYDPFSPTASAAIVARLSRGDEGLHGSVEIVDEQGISRGRRELESRNDRCDELARALALSISIAVDPEYEEREEEPLAPPGPPASAFSTSPVSAEVPAEDDRGPREPEAEAPAPVQPSLSTAFLGMAMLGVSPGVAFGGGGRAELRFRALSLAAGVRVAASPYSDVSGVARLRTTLAAAELAGCGHEGFFSLCWLALVGPIWARSEQISRPRTDAGLFVASGGRMALVVPFSGVIAGTAQAEVLLPLWRPSAEVDVGEVWAISSVAATGALGIVASFP